LAGVASAYGVYVVGASMEPRYFPGELVLIHPGKPVTLGAFVLVQRKPKHDGDPPLAVIKRLIKRTASRITLEQFNPAKSFDIRSDDIVSIHRVVGASEA
jgi:phage repressor protein C with HTH and peptisase S24 domain